MTMMLTEERAQELHATDPFALARMALEHRDGFVFAVRDLRGGSGHGWGGEVRVCVNQNVVLHFVPRLDEETPTIESLPQFAVMPSDEEDGVDQVHPCAAPEELDPFDGVVYWVEPERYRAMLDELAAIARRFDERAMLPDTLYAQSQFVPFIADRVLSHKLARDERPYDFSKRTF